MGDQHLRRHVGVHGWEGADYFNREAFERLTRQLAAAEVVLLVRTSPALSKAAVARLVSQACAQIAALESRAAEAGYRVDRALGESMQEPHAEIAGV